MDYPIRDGHETIGTLTVREEGLFRVFRARCAYREGVRRLWLCGEGEPVCLGVLQPQHACLLLEKRLSRAACAALPRPLAFAALARPAPESSPEKTSPAPPVPGPRIVCLFGDRFVLFRS